MATLSQPIWTPDPVTSLPCQTTVTFTVTPNGSSVQVQYTLQSPQLQFKLGDAAADAAKSSPVPPGSTAGPGQIVDVLNALTGPTRIERLLTVAPTGGTKPGIARIRVCVSDFDTGTADETNCAGAMISFNL